MLRDSRPKLATPSHPHSLRIFGPYATEPIELRGTKPDRMKDLYYFLLTTSWPLLLLLLAGAFLVLNTLFAAGYHFTGGIANVRGNSFADAFFFSVQTMATIGYGQMAPHALAANILVTIQSFAALLGIALMTGLSFAKFSLPTARVRFSAVMVIGPHNGRPCLMFRMSNLRLNQIVEARVSVSLVRSFITVEGQPFRSIIDLALERDLSPVFGLTWTAIHPIVDGSPLLGSTPESLATNHAGIVVSMNGTDGTLLQTVHVRHTYGVGDIRWNARFVDVMEEQPDGSTVIDLTHFDDFVQLPSEA